MCHIATTSLFHYRNTLINIVQIVCCNMIGFLILILSWWSLLNAMDLHLISRHPCIWVSSRP